MKSALSDNLAWRKSSLSSDTANCVEFAPTQGGVAVRDSKDPNGPILRFSREVWNAFVADVRAGAFTQPEHPALRN